MVTVPKPYHSAKHVKMTTPFSIKCSYYKNLLNCYSNRFFEVLKVFRIVMFISSDNGGGIGAMTLRSILVTNTLIEQSTTLLVQLYLIFR